MLQTRLQRALAITLLACGALLADDSKISPDLQPLLANSSSSINVIVQYNSPPQTCTSGGLLGGLLCTTVNLLGGVVHVVFSLLNAVAGTLTPSQVVSLSNQSNVTYISLDRSVHASLDYSTAAANAPVAWAAGLNGSGIGVAVIDSGIYHHPDLNAPNSTRSRVVFRQSFVGGTQYDDFGHGTHVAGIIAGSGLLSNVTGSEHVLRGVAPNANLIDLRVLDANGESSDSVVIQALQQAVALKTKYNIRVINLSLGRPIYETCTRDPLCQAVEAAWKQGIVVVVAAGNLGRNGYATVLSPGNSPHAITVGAMKTEETYPRTDDEIASYSSKGPTYIDLTAKPDVVAPGNLVVSLLAPGSTLSREFPANIIAPSYYKPGATGPAEYFKLSGTSMATPVVSGAAALMIEKNPSITPDTVKARLMKTASKSFPAYSTATDPTTGQTYVDAYDMFTVGAGYVDIAAALADYDTATRSAASPSVLYNPLLMQANVLLGSYYLWNSSTAWSTGAVWGTNVLWGSSTIWNAGAVWGTSVNWGTSVSWGTGGTSGTSVSWGTSGNGEK